MRRLAVGVDPMQDNNEDNKNNETEAVKPTGGDVFHPEALGGPNATPVQPASPGVVNSDHIPALGIPTAPQQLPKKRSKKGLLALVFILVIAVAGAAWFFTKSEKNSTNNSTETKETQDIELLRVGGIEGPASVYFPDEGLVGVETILNRQIYEGLVGFDDNKPVPLIAQSWTNPDEKTWIFKIHPGVKFHTGKVVDAKELKASLDDLKQFGYWSLFVSTIDTIEATGDLELTIKTKEPDALLLNRLTQAFIRDTAAPDALGMNGTGAYLVDKTAKNDEKSTTLVAFNDYYGGHAKTRKLVFSIFENDDQAAQALKNKEIDLMETLTFPAIKKELTEAGFTYLEYESPGVFGLYMNVARNNTTILKNKDIRTALAQAIDRQGLVDALGNKNSPSTQVIPKSLAGHDASITMPAFDVAAAKESLTKAGYKDTPLEFLYVQDLQLDPPILIKQLQAAGFKVKEKVYSSDEVEAALDELGTGRWDLFSAGFSTDILDARDVLGTILHSTESSYGNYSDPVYDKLLTDSDKEFDPVKRTQLLQQANKYIADNIAWIPTRNNVYVTYFGKDLDVQIDYASTNSIGTYYRNVGRIVQ